ncbi:MAG: hypothetical protein Q7V63_05785 [Gammaproteobacteria bacterium]|nr:hypothetical protein [Gammaproteobacteria bacterium]
MSKLKKNPDKKDSDPILRFQLSRIVLEELELHAEQNFRTVKEEIMARLTATLRLNEEFMVTDRLMRLIYCKDLAYKKSASDLN